ncbi:MAG: hypothetical protein ABI907_00055 [Ramlibacter sp.]
MKLQSDALADGRESTLLWVMLPGAYMKPADFIEAGFADAVRRRNLPHDIALLDASVTDVANGSALLFVQEFLRADTGRPRRRICLLGISLGAHLAMACLSQAAAAGGAAAAAADQVDCSLLLAPYLGPRDVIAQAAANPGPLAVDAGDIDRQIWRWLRSGADGRELYLGYGSDDRFARAHELMAQCLPPGHVDVQPGGHTWPVWTALWNRHLDQHHAC